MVAGPTYPRRVVEEKEFTESDPESSIQSIAAGDRFELEVWQRSVAGLAKLRQIASRGDGSRLLRKVVRTR